MSPSRLPVSSFPIALQSLFILFLLSLLSLLSLLLFTRGNSVSRVDTRKTRWSRPLSCNLFSPFFFKFLSWHTFLIRNQGDDFETNSQRALNISSKNTRLGRIQRRFLLISLLFFIFSFPFYFCIYFSFFFF
jgi:hypothetical protein